MSRMTPSQDDRYRQATAQFGAALERLARAFEADPDLRLDLLQDIHLALWRSFAGYEDRCALRTWVYRVAHNVTASHVAARRRVHFAAAASLDELAEAAGDDDPERSVGDQQALDRLLAAIRALKPPDAQVMLLYLEDIDAAGISDITGLSPGAVATRISRAKALMARRFQTGGAR